MTKYILIYKDGKYVQRDDSTGPMSTGGYPYPTEDIWRATRWDTPEAAFKYAKHFIKELKPYAYPVEATYSECNAMAFEFIIEPQKVCNRKCPPTPETMHPDAAHYLDCPVWGFGK